LKVLRKILRSAAFRNLTHAQDPFSSTSRGFSASSKLVNEEFGLK
jgi:hypothetical protein